MKTKILFVDDDPIVITDFKSMLKGLPEDWEVSFAESGKEALKLLSGADYNVILSDILMPQMDGVQLLKKVSELYPELVRVFISDQSEKELLLKSCGISHQFINKPCKKDVLIKLIEQSSGLRKKLADRSLKQLIAALRTLPSLPSLYSEILEAIQLPGTSLAMLGKIIEKDVAMTSEILKIVNSAYFGLPYYISSSSLAASFLGIDPLKALILYTHIFSEFKSSKSKLFKINDFFKHSKITGMVAREIAKKNHLGREIHSRPVYFTTSGF